MQVVNASFLDFTAYYNATAAENPSVNVPLVVSAMTGAAVEHYTGSRRQLLTKTFPMLFTTKAIDPLQGLSIIDFIAGNLLPYLLYFFRCARAHPGRLGGGWLRRAVNSHCGGVWAVLSPYR